MSNISYNENRDIRILSFQPYSIYQNGGSSRVLRRYYENKEKQIYSLCILNRKEKLNQGLITEKAVYARPVLRSWMRGPLRKLAAWLRLRLYHRLTEKAIIKAINVAPFDVLHTINQNLWSAVPLQSLDSSKKLWVAFHDHFSTIESPKKHTELLWNKADRRLVISKELGEEYQKVFGYKEFEIITDGVSPEEISEPKQIDTTHVIKIYFMGLVHIDYLPLFKILADALDLSHQQGYQFEMIIRGAEPIHFLQNRKFRVIFRNDFISDSQIKKEMDAADILYLPIKFSVPNFYRYSLSTKMIGYLSAPGTILYHGPKESAANILLEDHNSAISCTLLDAADMIIAIQKVLEKSNGVSENAKKLAYNKFNLMNIQKLFWQIE